jgi:hypothetical protein
VGWFRQTRRASALASLAQPDPVAYPGSEGQPFPLLVDVIKTFSGPEKPDVLMFGDSVVERVSRHDQDRRTLGAIVEATSTRRVKVISRSAFNPTLAAYLMRVLARLSVPEVLILPVNIRTFSPQWDLNPAWAFLQERSAIEAWLGNPEAPIPAIRDVIATSDFYDRFESTPVSYELSKLSTIGAFLSVVRSSPLDEDSRRQRSREILVFHYGHRLESCHRRLLDLAYAAESAKRLGIKPVIYVTPLNLMAAARHGGQSLVEIIRANIELIRATLAETGIELHDLSSAIPADGFFHEDLATEHLCEKGRVQLASRIHALMNSDAGRLKMT